MLPELPSETVPDGVSVLPVPTFFVSYVSEKFAVSEPCNAPLVMVGAAAAEVVASYVFEFAAAVTVIARAVITPVVLLANVIE